jgi:hypothetical protein
MHFLTSEIKFKLVSENLLQRKIEHINKLMKKEKITSETSGMITAIKLNEVVLFKVFNN